MTQIKKKIELTPLGCPDSAVGADIGEHLGPCRTYAGAVGFKS